MGTLRNSKRPIVLSKNYTCNGLRRTLNRTNKRVIIRLGSVTEREADIHINTVQAVKNSSSKFIMKNLFDEAGINHADWFIHSDVIGSNEKGISTKEKTIEYPIVAKLYFGKQGKGMYLIRNLEDYLKFMNEKPSGKYIIEKYYNYAKEYRIHVSKLGHVMSWRKLRRSDSTERWFFNSHNCNWVSENHELFDKPKTWENIIEQCISALNATKLSIGACDVRVNKKGEFIICEINSAPSLGENGVEIYKEHLNHLIQWEINQNVC